MSVSTPALERLARLSRHVLCVGIALGLGLTCAVLAVAFCNGMSGMSQAADPVTEARASDPDSVAPGAPSASVTSFLSAQMASMCEDVCAGGTSSGVCAMAAGVAVASVLVLLVLPANTFLRLLKAPTYLSGLIRRRLRRRTPGVLLSPVALCVLRV